MSFEESRPDFFGRIGVPSSKQNFQKTLKNLKNDKDEVVQEV
ncbi:hypothetical protein LEP1GSC188_4968 [Leptospira weilii serovar Topaz str. LT2116]|uniref:Uncharacterized protein n=1 Tax=Leptospira weilii serovar Topaz str. LT2116 TaxID=1088540 RepID=M3GYA6_9LEPT|nr:hypothetical protein LEP1GSC188_4968 [Leptospira weilii serovar Topaz str. LT2116]